MSESPTQQAATAVAERLRQSGKLLVLAESCTAGLVAASLGEVPGISEHLCGSAVVYRNATKVAWLNVSATDLEDSSVGAVSAPVAAAMATGVLERTSEADLAASITGDLGPGAPAETDGRAFIALASRSDNSTVRLLSTTEVRLSDAVAAGSTLSLRQWRQREAAVHVLDLLAATIDAGA